MIYKLLILLMYLGLIFYTKEICKINELTLLLIYSPDCKYLTHFCFSGSVLPCTQFETKQC